jgi:hypothetical protein
VFGNFVLRKGKNKRYTSGSKGSGSGRTGVAGKWWVTEEHVFVRLNDNISPGLDPNFCATFVFCNKKT